MGHYIIDAVRLDTFGEVEHVRWSRVDGMANELEQRFDIVEVDRVVEALDRGDIVETTFPTADGTVSGGYLARKVLPGGFENVQEANPIEHRMLRDMQTFVIPEEDD